MSTTPTVLPSRRTVARSQRPATSSMRWEMKMTERDVPRCSATTSRTRAVRSAGSAAVISSRSRTSGSMASARARSTTRSVASGRSRAWVRRSRFVIPRSAMPGAERFDRGLGQREVLRDGQVRDDRRLLVDRHHAGASRLCRRGDVAFLAPQSNRAAIGPDGAGEDLDEGALAGSVRAHEGVDLAGSNGKRCVAQCGHRAVALLDAGGLEQELRHRLRFPVSGIGRERRHRAGAPVIGVR